MNHWSHLDGEYGEMEASQTILKRQLLFTSVWLLPCRNMSARFSRESENLDSHAKFSVSKCWQLIQFLKYGEGQSISAIHSWFVLFVCHRDLESLGYANLSFRQLEYPHYTFYSATKILQLNTCFLLNQFDFPPESFWF